MKHALLCILILFIHSANYPITPIPEAPILTSPTVLQDAQILYINYGIHPHWPYEFFYVGQQISPAMARVALPYLITCESQGEDRKEIDDNGFYSYGILQYQSSTWNKFVSLSGITGDPMNDTTAIAMGIWALEHGYIARWSCSKLTGLLPRS